MPQSFPDIHPKLKKPVLIVEWSGPWGSRLYPAVLYGKPYGQFQVARVFDPYNLNVTRTRAAVILPGNGQPKIAIITTHKGLGIARIACQLFAKTEGIPLPITSLAKTCQAVNHMCRSISQRAIDLWLEAARERKAKKANGKKAVSVE